MGKSVYLIAAVITTLVFVVVFLLVAMDESARIESLSDEITALYEEQQASKILQSYLENPNADSCAVFEAQISRQLNSIYALFSELERLENTTFAVSKEKVKRQYLLASMSLWVDLLNAKQKCSIGIKPVLFFFPEGWHSAQPASCVECDAMVEQLEAIKARCPETRVFAFPFESKDFEFVDLLKKQYAVSNAPALAVNDHVVYSIVPAEQILEWLECSA